jgi:hypothetical protein
LSRQDKQIYEKIFESVGNEIMTISIQDNLGTDDTKNFYNVVDASKRNYCLNQIVLFVVL